MSDLARGDQTYSIPFDKVWTVASSLAGGSLKRWKIIARDDIEGVIKAEAATLLTGGINDVVIRISLDENAQTRVDMESRSRKGKVDFGAHKRRVARFFRALDRRLQIREAK